MTPDLLALLQSHLADRYDLERELGGGGMSRVYLARDRELERPVVIKVLAPELGQHIDRERFQREILTSAVLQHPQIVPVYHAGAAGDLRYYVMPYLAGESLADVLHRQGALAADEVLRLLMPLARALAYAHREGVVHRDVKPGNILLSNGEPVLADFGIAKVLRGDGDSTGLTSAGMSIGTVTYMPPEQVVADSTIDGRADVYSLAAVGYEMLTGSPPFTGTPAQVMSAHVVQAVPPLAARAPNAPAALCDALMRGLAKDAASRPDATAFAALLEAAARGDGGTGAAAARAAPRSSRLVVGALFAVAVVGVVAWWQRGGSGPAPAAERPTVAVLPFELIGLGDDAYLSAGVTDEVMTGLAELPDLRVLSRTTVQAYQTSGFTPMQYGEEADVRALVEGSVQRSGDRVRVSARLVDTRDGSAVWADRYEHALTDLFETQRAISAAVTAALRDRLGLRVASDERASYRADPAAYDQFLRARYAQRDRGEAGLRDAVARFSDAARRDAAFARAFAGIAEAAALLPLYSNVRVADVADTIRASALRAIALDSLLATPHVALGLLEKGLGRWTESEHALREAVRLAPDDGAAQQALGELLFTLGEFDASRAALERAALIEPTDEAIVSEFAWALLLNDAVDSAARTVARVEDAAPRNPLVAFAAAMVAERQGDQARSVALLRLAAVTPVPFFQGALARALRLHGAAREAEAIEGTLDTLSAGGAAFARAVSRLTTTDAQRFERLAQAAAEADPFVLMLPLRSWWYDPARDDPRFRDFAADLGLPPSSWRARPGGAQR